MQINRRLVGVLTAIGGFCVPGMADLVTFDFDTAPYRSSLPVNLTSGGLQADLTATGQGFSIQAANTMGFAPAGFSGLCIYPNSIYASDLHIGFSQALTNLSILYADQENGCDTAALMRITAYRNGVYVGNSTAMANAGTWPSATLSVSSASTFDSIIIHYDTPPNGENWGPIFMADNMIVTTAVPVPEPSGAAAIGIVAGQMILRRRQASRAVPCGTF